MLYVLMDEERKKDELIIICKEEWGGMNATFGRGEEDGWMLVLSKMELKMIIFFFESQHFASLSFVSLSWTSHGMQSWWNQIEIELLSNIIDCAMGCDSLS